MPIKTTAKSTPPATWISSRSSSPVHPAPVISNFKTQGLPLSRTEVAFPKLVHYKSPVDQTPVHLFFDLAGQYCNRSQDSQAGRLRSAGIRNLGDRTFRRHISAATAAFPQQGTRFGPVWDNCAELFLAKEESDQAERERWRLSWFQFGRGLVGASSRPLDTRGLFERVASGLHSPFPQFKLQTHAMQKLAWARR